MLDFSWGSFDGSISSTGTVTGDAITASRASTRVLDLLDNPSTANVIRDIGQGYSLGILVEVTEVFATLTSLEIDLQVSADNSTFYTIMSSPVYPVAQLIVGAPIFRYALPPNQELNSTAGVLKVPPRYIRLNYTVAGSNATTGKVYSALRPLNDRKQFVAITANYSVSVASGEI
jgi:hypothetical protein